MFHTDITSKQQYDEWAYSGESGPMLTIRTPSNSVRGCDFVTWVSGNCDKDLWTFAIDSSSLYMRRLLRQAICPLNGMTSSQIRLVGFKDFQPITIYMTLAQKKSIQLVLNAIQKTVDTSS